MGNLQQTSDVNLAVQGGGAVAKAGLHRSSKPWGVVTWLHCPPGCPGLARGDSSFAAWRPGKFEANWSQPLRQSIGMLNALEQDRKLVVAPPPGCSGLARGDRGLSAWHPGATEADPAESPDHVFLEARFQKKNMTCTRLAGGGGALVD